MMNFLNKKHVSTFSNTNNAKGYASQQEDASFSPYTASYINNKNQLNKGIQLKQSVLAPYQPSSRHERQQYGSIHTQKITSKQQLPSHSIIPAINLCQQHQNQILRHLCLQCNELLCSECISQHLQCHRQRSNTIPKIETINKLKKDMNIKSQKILQFMEENNPKIVLTDSSQLKYEAITKIHEMKEEVVKAFEEWCKILEKHVIEDLIEEKQLGQLANEMGKLKEQVLGMYNQMIGPQTVNAEIIKKVHQIDNDKLQAAYLQMFNKFSKTVLRSKFTFQIDFNYLMETFEKAIILRPLHAEVRSQRGEEEDLPIVEEERRGQSGSNVPLNQMFNHQQQFQQERRFMEIQSIESMVQPLSSQRQQGINMNTPISKFDHQPQQNSDGNRSRKMSRNASGKKLSIFASSQEDHQKQQNKEQTKQ